MYSVVFPIMIFGLVLANVRFAITGILLAIYGMRTVLLLIYMHKYGQEM